MSGMLEPQTFVLSQNLWRPPKKEKTYLYDVRCLLSAIDDITENDSEINGKSTSHVSTFGSLTGVGGGCIHTYLQIPLTGRFLYFGPKKTGEWSEYTRSVP
jgi:hypothetical protein